MKKGKQRALLWVLAGLLIVAGVSLKGMNAEAAAETATLTEISSPGEIYDLIQANVGVICSVDDVNRHFTFTVTEPSKVFFRTGTSIGLYEDASLTKRVEFVSCYGYDYYYFLEPGQYYVYHNRNYVYGYILPVSKVMNVTYALNADKSAANIIVSSALSSFKIDWAANKVAAADIDEDNYFPNTVLVDTFEVGNNGTYTIRLTSGLEDWRAYPVAVYLNVSGIFKCNHSFTAYDSNAKGHTAKCSKCGKFMSGKAVAHTADSGTVTQKATTLKNGIKVYKCKVCGYQIKTENIPKLKSHAYHKVLTDDKTKGKYRVTVTADKGTPAVEYYRSSKKASSVTIPAKIKIEGVTYKVTGIASGAFKGDTKVSKVTVGTNIKSIGANAFSGCKKLKTITVQSTKIKSVGKNAIKGISSKAAIKVPKSKKAAYTKLFSAKTGFKNTMKIK